MIKRRMVLALAVSLGACGESAPAPPPPPKPPRPPVIAQRFDWLAAEPECHGALRRGEWLVCDNVHLRYLHRTLAGQWETARRTAQRRELGLMRQQQEALLSERGLCEDAACVATAYRRYLAGYARPMPSPSWTPRPRPRPVKAVYRRHDWRDDNGWDRDYARPNRRRGEQSCAAELGGSASAYLVRQCRVVSGRWDRSCTADATCEDLRDQIGEGCSRGDRRPGFCNRR